MLNQSLTLSRACAPVQATVVTSCHYGVIYRQHTQSLQGLEEHTMARLASPNCLNPDVSQLSMEQL